MFDLKDQIALVTGASRGIGQSIALAMGKQGALVIGTSTSEAGSERVTALLQEKGIAGRGETLDVTNQPRINEIVKTVEKEFGPISVLVNNAGITRDNLLLKMKDEEWADILDTNLSSVYRVTKACLRGMIRIRKGRIINITSVVSSIGSPGQANYAATKAGIVGFTKSLASEVASREITANAIAPGFIQTDMTDGIGQNRHDELINAIPLRRLGARNEVAALAIFLASDEASYITGQVIHVNGGLYMGS